MKKFGRDEVFIAEKMEGIKNKNEIRNKLKVIQRSQEAQKEAAMDYDHGLLEKLQNPI